MQCPECKTENPDQRKKCLKCGARILTFGDLGIVFILLYFAAMFSIFFISLAVGSSFVQTGGFALVIVAFVVAGSGTIIIARYQNRIRKGIRKMI